MTYRTGLLAGSAIGLLVFATPCAWASPSNVVTHGAARAHSAPKDMPAGTVVAQDDPDAAQPGAAEEELLPKKKRNAEEPQPEDAAPAEQQPEAAPAEPAPEAQPQAEPAPEPQAEQPAPEAQPAEQPQAESEPAPQAEQPAPEAQPEQPAQQPQAEPEPAPQAEQPAPETGTKPAKPAEPAPEAKPEAPPAQQETPSVAPEPEAEPAPQPQSQPEATPEQAPAPQPAPAEPAPEAAPQPAPDQPATEQPDGTGQTQPEAAPPADSTVPPDSGTAEQPENAAPVLDSAKEAPAPAAGGGTAPAAAAPAEPAGPPPADDKAAQEAAQPAKVEAVTAEKGRRVEAPPPAIEAKRPQGVDVVKEIGDRIVIQINNQVFVESSDRPRMTRGARDVYYEDLPRGRTRETVVRKDGTQVITIRNSYGDIVRRSRITPDGREYVLVYVDDRYYDRVEDWRDPGLDLPPMRLDVPMDNYILDAGRVEDPDDYYTFLERPPVERVERLYSVDEVKRSARIRDKVPRIELDTVTFEFGSAEIAESQIGKLEGVAEAMEKLLRQNPAETFLIEGHTDAVGSDIANLALSDRRAEAVATALTDVFGIPPENLATQGYGERYLKIKTQERERLNRRVVMRRITTLVAPVASAN